MSERDKIRDYIRRHITILDAYVDIGDDDDIFGLGFVDSMFAMELVHFIEKESGVAVSSEELILANFSTVANLHSLLMRKRKDD